MLVVVVVVAEGTTKTRPSVVWTDKQKELVMEKLKNFPSLKDYNFDNLTTFVTL